MITINKFKLRQVFFRPDLLHPNKSLVGVIVKFDDGDVYSYYNLNEERLIDQYKLEPDFKFDNPAYIDISIMDDSLNLVTHDNHYFVSKQIEGIYSDKEEIKQKYKEMVNKYV